MGDWLTVFDWLTPLAGLAQVAAGRVQFEGPVEAIVVLENAGISCGAPQLIHGSGHYLFTVSRKHAARARRVCARAGVEVW